MDHNNTLPHTTIPRIPFNDVNGTMNLKEMCVCLHYILISYGGFRFQGERHTAACRKSRPTAIRPVLAATKHVSYARFLSLIFVLQTLDYVVILQSDFYSPRNSQETTQHTHTNTHSSTRSRQDFGPRRPSSTFGQEQNGKKHTNTASRYGARRHQTDRTENVRVTSREKEKVEITALLACLYVLVCRLLLSFRKSS